MALVTRLLLAFAPLCAAQEFALEIGNPVAANMQMKTAALAVRAIGCTGVSISASGVRTAAGVRVAIPLTIRAGAGQGVWGVGPAPGTRIEGPWLAVVTGECGAARAGALIPFDARGLYQRDKAKFVAHSPTQAEIETALKEMD